MKLEPHLPQLPSIGELLEHPRVKGVVARINRSTLAQRAAGFLDEWRSALVKQAGRVELPSVSDLAERLARRLLGEPSGEGAVINATGVVIGDPRLAPPLADTAVQAMMQAASEYHGRESPLAPAVERLLCGLTGAEAAVVVHSYEGGLTLALSSSSGGREAAVVGDAAGESGRDWQWLAARSGAVLRSLPNAAAIGSAAGSSRVGAIVQTGTDLVADLAPVIDAARSRHA